MAWFGRFSRTALFRAAMALHLLWALCTAAPPRKNVAVYDDNVTKPPPPPDPIGLIAPFLKPGGLLFPDATTHRPTAIVQHSDANQAKRNDVRVEFQNDAIPESQNQDSLASLGQSIPTGNFGADTPLMSNTINMVTKMISKFAGSFGPGQKGDFPVVGASGPSGAEGPQDDPISGLFPDLKQFGVGDNGTDGKNGTKKQKGGFDMSGLATQGKFLMELLQEPGGLQAFMSLMSDKDSLSDLFGRRRRRLARKSPEARFSDTS